MATTRAVLDLLRRPESQLGRQRKRGGSLPAIFIAIVWLLLFAYAAFTLSDAYSLWQSGEWHLDWDAVFRFLVLVGMLLRLFFLTDTDSTLYEPVAALRAAVVSGDAALAPPADAALATPEPSPLPNLVSVIGPLRRPPSVGVFLFAVLGGIVAFFGFLSAGITVSLPETQEATVWVALGSVLWTLAVIATILWLRRPLRVRLEDDGLAWRTPMGRRRRLAWRNARACFVFTERRGTDYALVTTYFLDGGRRVLAWRAKPRDATPDTVAAWRLAAEVVLHTGLALRDVSAEVSRIALLTPPARAAARRRRTAVPVPAVPVPADDGAAVVTPPKIRPSPLTWIVPLLLVALVLGGVLGGVLGVQVYQAHEYAQLYAQAHAHAPLFSDTLSAPDAYWPQGDAATFSGSAYLIPSGVAESVPRVFDNALYEVTGSTYGGDDLGGVGLTMLGLGNSLTTLQVRVTPSGECWLDRTRQLSSPSNDDLQIVRSGSIHGGFQVPNRIAMLVRGADYTFYVNGQYVVGIHDDALRGAEIALYTDDTSTEGAFKDYAVYPLN